jgi:hypothetical protein
MKIRKYSQNSLIDSLTNRDVVRYDPATDELVVYLSALSPIVGISTIPASGDLSVISIDDNDYDGHDHSHYEDIRIWDGHAAAHQYYLGTRPPTTAAREILQANWAEILPIVREFVAAARS